MNPIEQLALAAMQRASEAQLAEPAPATPSSVAHERADLDARVALRKERNRQSAASSRKRAKLRTEELEEENSSLRTENERLRRLLSNYSLRGLIDPDEPVPDKASEEASGSHTEGGAECELGATTSSTPLNTPPLGPACEPPSYLNETRVLLPSAANKQTPKQPFYPALDSEQPTTCKSLTSAIEAMQA
mmetsp:Transcript_40715/g.93466  ORF Transcript_40715/g.93466 Transcript_40715/m.93466 type:complete len:190 (+) Transcript_40715:352-921(+)